MPRYYKYLPWFILERKLNKIDPFYADKVTIGKEDREIVLLKISDGVWIGTNHSDYWKSQKTEAEKRIKEYTRKLEEANGHLQEVREDLTVLCAKETQ